MHLFDRRLFLTSSAAWLAGTGLARAFWPFGREGSVVGGRDIRVRPFKG
ncbi:MAG: hypothetical protein HKP58_05695, partial [Desulfatitalea sp.]|nr:hypothetical protein [Desulfatitalea sp.]